MDLTVKIVLTPGASSSDVRRLLRRQRVTESFYSYFCKNTTKFPRRQSHNWKYLKNFQRIPWPLYPIFLLFMANWDSLSHRR